MKDSLNMINSEIKPIAFYLPQFHPFPENDKWWGKGFTEWRNVAKAQPRFKGHYQPHAPGDLGFYDLRVPETREAQADLAKQYGIYGFCYYHYWFGGKKLMERPINEVLKSKKPDFPFCVCWANENWTRRWDGREEDVLIGQNHSDEDDIAFIKDLIPAFKDDRYIRVKNKPMLLIWRPLLLPDAKRTSEIWRQEVRKHGIDDLYIVAVESWHANINPEKFGYDACTQFAPQTIFHYDNNIDVFGVHDVIIANYAQTMDFLVNLKQPDYTYFRGVFNSWDNTARREKDGFVFYGSSPIQYAYFLNKQIKLTQKYNKPEEQFIFINAWNEWAEGAHLEPDLKYGHTYLQATYDALNDDVVSEIEIQKYHAGDFEPLFTDSQASLEEIKKLNEVNEKLNYELKHIYSARSWKIAQQIHKLAKKYNISRKF